MAPDQFQEAWRADSTRTRLKVDANILLRTVQQRQRDLRAMIFWRDFREVGIALLLLPVWIYMGLTMALPWTWYLGVPVLIGEAGFMLMFRLRRREPHGRDESLLRCVESSLKEVEDHMWLLRNVFCWAVLPVLFAGLVLLNSLGWLPQSIQRLVSPVFGLVVVMSILYFVNRFAVRWQLVSRRQELRALQADLREESISDVPPVRVAKPSPAGKSCRFPVGVLDVVVGALLLVIISNVAADTVLSTAYSKKSPFTAVRWRESRPHVKLGDDWFKLVSLNELPASEIVAFSRRTYGNRWRKRFEEDLVELLTGMGHPPGDEVSVVVRSLISDETSIRRNLPLTEDNRQAIWYAGQARAIPDSLRERPSRSAVSLGSGEQFKTRVDEFLELARLNAGFSGVVAVAQRGEIIYHRSVGFSHLASKTPNSLDTPFRVAAITQTFTAAAILALESDGKLDVEDPVHLYLPEFSVEPYRNITIYHLLTHSSGLPRIPEGKAGLMLWDVMSRNPTPVEDNVRVACQSPLKFAPGQRRQYTNIGYRVLSALIVRVTGKDYADFMQERVFDPLALGNTGVARISRPATEAAVAESVSLTSENRRSNEPSFVRKDAGRNYGSGYGSSAIYTSVNDLLRWDRVLAGVSFLSAEQRARMFRPYKEDFACGWVVKKSGLDGRLYHSNSGANYGHICRMMRIPEDDLVIICLSNAAPTREMDEALEQLFLLCRSLPYREM